MTITRIENFRAVFYTPFDAALALTTSLPCSRGTDLDSPLSLLHRA
jgi:hypothetical protein